MSSIATALANKAAALWSDGGQSTARRNAWAAMVGNNIRAKSREAAESAMAQAQHAASHDLVSANRG